MWWIIGTIIFLMLARMVWDVYKAPLMPDDYGLDKEDELFLKDMKNVH